MKKEILRDGRSIQKSKKMEDERILFSEVIKIPSPETILTIFWQVIIYFWKAERNIRFYREHTLPHSLEEIPLRIDHRFHERARFHVFPMTSEDATGVWDETCYWIDYTGIHNGNLSPDFMEHGDYRHAYQLFLKSFLKTLKKYVRYYPVLQKLQNVLLKMSILKWKCPVCKKYNGWSRDFIDRQILESDLSIAPSTLLFLLNYRNEYRREEDTMMNHGEITDMMEILQVTLGRFFDHFTTIYHQTSINPILILQNLIDILEKHARGKRVEEIGDFESACAREMKHYIFTQFKYMKTKDVRVSRFPRDLMISRDVFRMMLFSWKKKEIMDARTTASSSPGILILLHNLIFDDRALAHSRKSALLSISSPPILVIHPVSHHESSKVSLRNLTPPEADEMMDYHPILRPLLFT